MKKLIFTISLLLFAVIYKNYSQTQFQLTIGGTNSDGASSIIQTTDGGYAVAGSTSSFGAGNSDMYIVKLNSSGTIQWTKTIGGTNGDYATSIIQTTDGGYAVAGYSGSFGAVYVNIFIMKLDPMGAIQWSKNVNGTGWDYATSIIQTTDGGYAVACSESSFGLGMCIMKLNSSGTLQWIKTLGTSTDITGCIIQTTDGGYAIAGDDTFGTSYYDVYIVKFDANWTLQWSKSVGGSGDECAYSIIQSTDGGYAVAGYTNSFGAGDLDIYIVKLNASGTLQWTRTVGGTGVDRAYSIVQTTDGGYAVAGNTNSFGVGSYDMYIVKLNASGTLLWSKTVGGTAGDYASSIIKTTDGGYAVAGSTSSFGAGNGDMYIVKFDANWNTCGNTTSPSSSSGTGGTTTSLTSTVTSPTSTVTTPSPTSLTGGTLTTLCFVGIQSVSNEIPKEYELYQNYPNPFNPTTKIKFEIPNPKSETNSNIEIRIYDVLGKEVATLVNEKLQPGSYEVTWDGSNYSSGVYFYKITAGNFTDTKKMLMIK